MNSLKTLPRPLVEALQEGQAAEKAYHLKRIYDACMSDPANLARFVAALAEPGFVFLPCHAEWMGFVSAPPKSNEQPMRMLLAPRTHGKSTVANLAHVIWRILHDPNIRILIASETDLQARGFMGHLQHVFENQVFQAVFGDLKGSQWGQRGLTVKGRTKILKEPTVMAMGVGSALPSFHFDMIVLDDVIDDDDVHTEAQRKAVRDWYFQTLEPTLTKNGTMCVIGTRWHYFDLYGSLIESGGFAVKRYQAIQSWSKNEKLWDKWIDIALSVDPESQREAEEFLSARREEMYEGTKVLLPEVWPYEKLMLKRARSGSSIFAKQYQNEPTLGEGRQIFKVTDFRFYGADNLPGRDEFLCVVSGYDLAISEQEQADYTAVVTVGVTFAGMIYVLKAFRDHLSFDAQVSLIRNTHAEWNEDLVAVESVQYQQALANVVKRWTAIPVKKYSPQGDKVTRALRVQPQVEGHRVLFSSRQRALTQELAEFPFSEHDDLVDAFTSAVSEAVELAADMRERSGRRKASLYI